MSGGSMSDFSAFGTTVAAEFRGDYANATLCDNVALSPERAIQPVSIKTPSEIGWIFTGPVGRRAIFVRYAAKKELPCELLINGEVAQANALFESTETTKLIDWRYQCHADFDSGENSISIRSAKNMPLIHEVAVVDIDTGEMLTVDASWQRREEQRAGTVLRAPLVVVPSAFQGVLDTIRSVAKDDAAIKQMKAILNGIASGCQIASDNGQASIPWGGPLNGQRYRQQIFARMMRVNPDAIIETGTYLGASTAHFARQGVPVHTCESHDQNYARAIVNLTEFSNVRLYLQDSRAFLKGLAGDPAITYDCPLFYLDAHWYNDLPLAEEIAIIRDRWPRFMIMVDDFEVPGTNYGFDRYTNGLELTLDYLRKENIDLASMAVMFPTAAETSETSVRRGTLMLSSLDIYDEHLKYERTMFRYNTEKSATA